MKEAKSGNVFIFHDHYILLLYIHKKKSNSSDIWKLYFKKNDGTQSLIFLESISWICSLPHTEILS